MILRILNNLILLLLGVAIGMAATGLYLYFSTGA